MRNESRVRKAATVFEALSVVVAMSFLKLRFQLSSISVMAQLYFLPYGLHIKLKCLEKMSLNPIQD